MVLSVFCLQRWGNQRTTYRCLWQHPDRRTLTLSGTSNFASVIFGEPDQGPVDSAIRRIRDNPEPPEVLRIAEASFIGLIEPVVANDDLKGVALGTEVDPARSRHVRVYALVGWLGVPERPGSAQHSAVPSMSCEHGAVLPVRIRITESAPSRGLGHEPYAGHHARTPHRPRA